MGCPRERLWSVQARALDSPGEKSREDLPVPATWRHQPNTGQAGEGLRFHGQSAVSPLEGTTVRSTTSRALLRALGIEAREPISRRSCEAARNRHGRACLRRLRLRVPQHLQQQRVENLDRAHGVGVNLAAFRMVIHRLVPRRVRLSSVVAH